MVVPSESGIDDRISSLASPLLPPSEYATWEAAAAAPRSEQEKLCIDDMLQKYCGEFGFWQLRHFVLTSLAWALEAFHSMVMIFADREPDWRCVNNGSGSWCDETAKTMCGLQPGSWEWVSGPGSSTVSQWGLVCAEKYKIGLVQASFFGGCMIGKSSSSGLEPSLCVYFILFFNFTRFYLFNNLFYLVASGGNNIIYGDSYIRTK